MNTHKEPTRLEQELQNLIQEFRDFNITEFESDKEAYAYDFIGFSEWLEFEKGVKAQELAPLEPTPPSQIEEDPMTEKEFQLMVAGNAKKQHKSYMEVNKRQREVLDLAERNELKREALHDKWLKAGLSEPKQSGRWKEEEKLYTKEEVLEVIGEDPPHFKYIDFMIDDQKREACKKLLAKQRERLERLRE